MKKLWNKIKAYCSGWPEGSEERIQEKVDASVKQEVLDSQARKAKKPKGLNPKKKKKKKIKKQGNLQ